MFRSLHMKLMLIMTLLIISLMTVVGAFLINSVANYYTQDFYTQMSEAFGDPDFWKDLETPIEGEEDAASSIAHILDTNSTLGIDNRSRKYYVLDGTDGHWLAGSDDKESGQAMPNDSRNLMRVLAGEDASDDNSPAAAYMDETNSQIEQANLELESITNEINDYNSQIATLSAERDAAPEEAKFDYTTQIQSVQNDLKQSEYNRKSKQLEIDKMKQSLGDAVVTSKMAGVVKTVNNSNGGSDDGSSDDAFMTILATGSYRVKCMINEQNMSEISEGEQMLIHSRVDEDQTWNGTISGIDMESPQSNGDQYTDSSDSSDTTTSSKYPFYINLENSDGMMLGQHVFAEADLGQGQKKKGIWLMESYIVKEKKEAYVWADNGKGKLEKRKVELGKYDEELGEYKIKSGLKKDDYIAWPMDGLYEGVEAVKNESEVDYDAPLYKDQQDSTEPYTEDSAEPADDAVEPMSGTGQPVDGVEAEPTEETTTEEDGAAQDAEQPVDENETSGEE